MHFKTKQMENQTLTYEGLVFAQALSENYGEDIIESIGYKAFKIGIKEVIYDFREKDSGNRLESSRTPQSLKSSIEDFCIPRTAQIIGFLEAISINNPS